jgi:DNA ligase-1
MLMMNRMLISIVLFLSLAVNSAEKPDLLLAQVYSDAIDVKQYWISEKLDGVRAYWNGRQLISRGGHALAAPSWFIAGFPKNTLDGELWLGRGQFANTLSTASKHAAIDSEWRKLGYYVFELPEGEGTFSQRLSALQSIIKDSQSPYLHAVEQFRLDNQQQLASKLKAINKQGGEGLMLHLAEAPYHTGRSHALLKLKTYQDAEAVVIAHKSGKGKYQGMLGSLKVRTDSGQVFFIGSGLSDELRQNPPKIGEVITFRYNGLSTNGLPRFARFMRVRSNL